MLLQTNSYIVPKDKRSAHLNLMRRFRQVLGKLGCDHFEVFEQVGANWSGGDTSGRFVQLMKFRDRKHCQAVQLAEKSDPAAQQLVRYRTRKANESKRVVQAAGPALVAGAGEEK